ncbi:MAG: hypothetical protein ACRDB0_05455 [Paraclostridium sp.]
MEPKGFKEDLKKMILDMTQKELQNYVSQKGSTKHIEGKLDKIIESNIEEIKQDIGNTRVYTSVLKKGSYQNSINEITKVIKNEEIFKSKGELLKFARYLNLEVNQKQSYKILLKKVSTHIYNNRSRYSKKYIMYKKGTQEYALEPDKIRTQLVESYKSKARNDMKTIAKILDIKTEEYEGAEDIRKKVINYIIKDKLSKIKN